MTYLLASVLTSNVIGYNAVAYGTGATYPEAPNYFQPSGIYPTNYYYQSNVYIPAAQFTNGVAVLSNSQALPYAEAFFDILSPQLPGGAGGNELSAFGDNLVNVPFIDGTAQMKQNIRFLLRAASGSPFGFVDSDLVPYTPTLFYLTYPTNYVYSSLYTPLMKAFPLFRAGSLLPVLIILRRSRTTTFSAISPLIHP